MVTNTMYTVKRLKSCVRGCRSDTAESVRNFLYTSIMSSLHESVELNYKDLKEMWTRNDFSRGLKFWQSQIDLMYIYSVVLLKFKKFL